MSVAAAVGRGRVGAGCRRQDRGAGRDVGVRVDLPVRVVQGDADVGAPVFEREDLLDAGQCAERFRAVGPGVDHRAGAAPAQLGEGSGVLRGEGHHLAAADGGGGGPPARRRRDVVRGRPQGGEAVLKDGDVVVRRRDLGPVGRRRRADGALVRRRQVRARLPVRGDGDPLPAERIEAQLARLGAGGQLAVVHEGGGGPLRRPGVVKIEDFAAVGQAGHGGSRHVSVVHDKTFSNNRAQNEAKSVCV